MNHSDSGNNWIYKVAITSFTSKHASKAVFTDTYDSMVDALWAVHEEAFPYHMFMIEIRAYDRENQVNIIAFDNDKIDTGLLVYRNVETIMSKLKQEFKNCLEDEYFEGTMSSLISYLKEPIDNLPSEEFKYLHHGLSVLNDTEINVLLKETGDYTYVRCKNGEMVNFVPAEALAEWCIDKYLNDYINVYMEQVYKNQPESYFNNYLGKDFKWIMDSITDKDAFNNMIDEDLSDKDFTKNEINEILTKNLSYKTACRFIAYQTRLIGVECEDPEEMIKILENENPDFSNLDNDEITDIYNEYENFYEPREADRE